MLFNLGHMTREEHIWEVWGWVGNPYHDSIWCPHIIRAKIETLKRQRSTQEGDQESV
jgi:hypothetical protein